MRGGTQTPPRASSEDSACQQASACPPLRGVLRGPPMKLGYRPMKLGYRGWWLAGVVAVSSPASGAQGANARGCVRAGVLAYYDRWWEASTRFAISVPRPSRTSSMRAEGDLVASALNRVDSDPDTGVSSSSSAPRYIGAATISAPFRGPVCAAARTSTCVTIPAIEATASTSSSGGRPDVYTSAAAFTSLCATRRRGGWGETETSFWRRPRI